MFQSYLNILEKQKNEMSDLVQSWANINSGSENLSGLAEMLKVLKQAFSGLGAQITQVPLPPRKRVNHQGEIEEFPVGDALVISKHPNAPLKVVLGGHMDTVFSPSHPFQKAEKIDANTLRGPGVADMKGGLVIILKALEALEDSPLSGKLGWEVIINADEEIGSPSSTHLFAEAAKRAQLGLIFEPSFPDGSLVSSRKGSVNFTVVVRGKAAHVGRDFFMGVNAITAMARFIMGVDGLSSHYKGITVNVGSVEGGGAVNIVPDLAIARVNVRVKEPKDLKVIKQTMQEVVNGCISHDGISMVLYENVERAPKIIDPKTQLLFEAFKNIGNDLGIDLKWQPSGGVCDGNTLAAAGLPTIDTLGVVGGNIHTIDEYILIDSLPKRAGLIACFLMKLASEGMFFETLGGEPHGQIIDSKTAR